MASSRGNITCTAMSTTAAPAQRQRAPRACTRCNRLKQKCDAAARGPPCSRCRMDGLDECTMTKTRRGTYDRGARHRRQSAAERSTASRVSSQSADGIPAPTIGVARRSNHGHTQPNIGALVDGNQVSDQQSPAVTPDLSPTALSQVTAIPEHVATANNAAFSYRYLSSEDIQRSRTATDRGKTSRSLAGMFEDFVERQDNGGLGLILFNEASPLTFALEELGVGNQASLHDASPILSQNKRLVEDRRHGDHPRHLDADDIAYLHAKGALTAPSREILGALLDAFMTRFYPLYSIVNKSELLHAHEVHNIPWLMLHAICSIGATFCDVSVVRQLPFKSRYEARQAYYNRAKVLFDVGYETDKFVLLETMLMLSFLGPQMKSMYNACSWLGFAFTVAESMGIHRRTSSLRTSGKDTGRVKRLWWILAVRDAHCAALLGRPFRMNPVQSDTPMLDLNDFASELDGDNDDPAVFQILVASLSNISRAITQRRGWSPDGASHASDLEKELAAWKQQIPIRLQWPSQGVSTSVFASALKLLYHKHIILLHLGRAGVSVLSLPQYTTETSATIAEASAQVIASSASALVTRRMVYKLPHEVFTGFFVAGIIFYRQLRRPEPLVAQMARASLDNCQMLLNEVRDSWDPAHWALRIFDFLLSNWNVDAEQARQAAERPSPTQAMTVEGMLDGSSSFGNTDFSMFAQGAGQQDPWMPFDMSMADNLNDFLLMPNFFAPNG